MESRADIAVIGGTGLYSLFDGGTRHRIDTPYGPPSSPVTVRETDGPRLAFLARHGESHEYPAHRVPYRANIWALAALGVRRVFAVCAVGSLRADVGPGTVVVPDQLIDRTHGREGTFYDEATIHVPFADPFCPELRTATVGHSIDSVSRIRDGATVVVIPGPRFGTRAEAAGHRQSGADIVNMTAMPEAALARELALCYCPIAVVTDWDAGVDGATPVSQPQVMERFAASVADVKKLVLRVTTALSSTRDCKCGDALVGLDAPDLFLSHRQLPPAPDGFDRLRLAALTRA